MSVEHTVKETKQYKACRYCPPDVPPHPRIPCAAHHHMERLRTVDPIMFQILVKELQDSLQQAEAAT